MSLSAQAIALQGFGYGALQVGLQGLLGEEPQRQDSGGGLFAGPRVVRKRRDTEDEEALFLMDAI